MISALFDQYHNAPMGGHFNCLRTYEKLRILYYWPKMGQQIFARCEYCHAYQSARPRKPDNSGHMTRTPPSRPFERVSVDLIKLPRSVSENEYIAVFIDTCTCWPEAVAIPDKKATTVVRVMKDYIFARHGTPPILLPDEGSEFLNRLVTETCKLYGVTKVFSAAYHSRGHGMVERLNRTIEDELKHTTNVACND
jgi:transposase InsO family protein